jgi:hypothetical protein
MYADPYMDREFAAFIVGRELFLNLQCTFDRRREVVKRRHDAVPEVLYLGTTMLLQGSPDDGVVSLEQFHRPHIAELRRHLGRTHHVREHDGTEGRVGDRLRPGGGWILDATEKGLDGREIHRDHFVGHMSMGLRMDPVGHTLVWGVHKTECRSARRIVPIRQELHSILVLDFQVLDVQFGDILRGCFADVVAVQEYWHLPPPIHFKQS